MRHVAFLRAINVGRRRVTMERLRDVAGSLHGLRDVATYIASGNLIFEADPAPDLAERIDAGLTEGLGFEVAAFLRTSDEVRAVAGHDPFAPVAGARIHISFLPSRPDPEAVAHLVASAPGSDRLAVHGREVYWQHIGNMSESLHSEDDVVRILGMPTTRRAATTVQKIAAKYLGDTG